MVSIVPKWRVVVTGEANERTEFFYSDNHIQNVLSFISHMDFGYTVLGITIHLTR